MSETFNRVFDFNGYIKVYRTEYLNPVTYILAFLYNNTQQPYIIGYNHLDSFQFFEQYFDD